MTDLLSRFKGCLLGGAVGDALGAPVEFQSLAAIRKQYGAAGVTEFLPAYGGMGMITDDTQMSLFTAEALLRGHEYGDYLKQNGAALCRWYLTQTQPKPEKKAKGLAADPRLYSRRAPGGTCLSAIANMRDITSFANNDSKGCGTVMRMAPVGLFAFAQQKIGSFQTGCDFSRQTHGHPTGYIAGGLFAMMIELLASGESLKEAVSAIICEAEFTPYAEECATILRKADTLATSGLPHDQAIKLLGEGWIAEEALAISVYCALIAKDFRHGVLMAVNHDGDTDSTGSMTGNILGLLWGVEAIPQEWIDGVELRDLIEEMAIELATA